MVQASRLEKKTRKMKVFGLTTSTGKQLIFEVPYGKDQFSAVKWAKCLRSKVAPFLKQAFPEKASFNLLLDGEKLLHAPEANKVMKEFQIKTLPDWPGYSPELNPQEHVWSRAEPLLRELEAGDETFEDWKPKVLRNFMRSNTLVSYGGRLISYIVYKMCLRFHRRCLRLSRSTLR